MPACLPKCKMQMQKERRRRQEKKEGCLLRPPAPFGAKSTATQINAVPSAAECRYGMTKIMINACMTLLVIANVL